MKKIIYVVIFIAVIGLAVNLLANRASQDTNLAEKINSLLEKRETQIDLTEVTDFSWTQASVFGPYTSDEEIEEAMGIKFKGDNGGIDMLDDRFLLVFANDKYAVKTVVISRGNGTYIIKDNKYLIVDR